MLILFRFAVLSSHFFSAINCSLDLLQPQQNFYVLDKPYSGHVKYNDVITASCKPGYERRSGDSTRKCLADQSLSGTELVCSGTNITCSVTRDNRISANPMFSEICIIIAYI